MSYAAVAPLPQSLQLEVTSACNLRCAMCLVRYRPPVNKIDGAMSWPLFAGIVEELPGVRTVTLQGLGEPLLSPHLLDMIQLLKDRGARVGFNTNGTLLRRNVAERLVDMNLDWLHVSLDGSTAQTFESIRDGAAFETVVRHLSGLVAAKKRAGKSTPWIRVVFVAMQRNVQELPALVDLLADIGVDELRVQNLSHDFGDTTESGPYAEIRAYANREALDSQAHPTFDEARQRAAARGVDLRLPSLSAMDPSPAGPGCTWPWDSAYITSDGVVQPCCMVMGDDRVQLGRLGETPFADVWNGSAYQEFRQRLLDGDPPEVCRGCSLYRGTF
jgi:radical SAM protein with 4Fe4S-binding SPASM domain